KGVFSVVSREGALVLNNILLAVSCFVVFFGTLWPIIAEMFFDRKLSVGPPFFDMAFTPFMIGLGIALPIGALMPWKRGKVLRAVWSLRYAFGLALAFGVTAWAMQSGRSALGPIGLMLGSWVVFGAGIDIWSRTGKGRVAGRLARLFRLPRADWGRVLAHSGLGITMFAIAGLTAWQQEDIRVVQLGDRYEVGDVTLTLEKVEQLRGPNYFTTQATVLLEVDGRELARVTPEKRTYPVAKMPTTEAAIDYRFLRDIYVVIGDEQSAGGWAMRTYIKPLTNWIWGGTLLMALGGVLSLSDRRFRVAAGAGQARKPQKPTQVPAE
ncbi:MAG TPA: heme lyase NrfEFG subunit NrfE, partial [Roseibacterium sp.]|nr:heme lyase NrfEFG subunit NrfE [Roseibacterium sp.]